MKKSLLGTILLLAVCAVAARASMDRALVSIDNPGPETASALLDRDVMVLREMNGYLLAAADPAGLEVLEALGLEWKLLDESIEGKTYFTVGVGTRASEAGIRAHARILRFDGEEAVIEASQEDALKVAGLGLEIARVFIRPVRLSAEEVLVPLQAAAAVYDPLIQTMVNSVSSATIDANVQRLENFETRYATHDSCQAAADWIKAELESYGVDTVYYHNYSATYKDNVVGVIRGTADPDKIVVIGGHYDSITSNHDFCPGADDNASGTVCMMECARVLANYDFDYTIKFVAFGGEELGLYGSEGFASDAAAAGEDIIGALAVDMIGYVAGGDVLDIDIIDNASSQWMYNLTIDLAGLYVPDLPVVEGYLPGGASSDHASFWANGYDAILFFEDSGNYSPYIHTANDIVGLSYNSSTLAERSVKLALALMAEMARPFRVAISHTPLENTTDTTNPYHVVAEILGAGTLNADSLMVRYDTGSGEQTLTMSATGNPDEYEAYIPAQPGGTYVDYYIVAEDNDTNRTTHPIGAPAEVHSFFVGAITTIVHHDFESDQGWTVGDVDDDASTGVWDRCDPEATEAQPENDHTPEPGVNAYITDCRAGASIGTYDVDGGKTTLFSPIFDLSSYPNASVIYYRWYSNGMGASPDADDWLVHVSDDGGASWVTIDSLRSGDHTWREIERDLQAYITLTDQVRFRFIASDLGDGSIVEAGVDDFSLISYEDGTSGVADAGSSPGLMLAPNIPNPFSSETTLRFSVPSPGARVTLRIFDVRGREVNTLLEGERVEGQKTLRWDGTNMRGAAVPAGIYFCNVVAGDQSRSRKIVLAR
jgi:leucyl aminopeptidase